MVGYTRALAAAVWVGTNDGGPLITRTGSSDVFGSTHAGPIWQQFMRDATDAMHFDEGLRKFNAPVLTASPSPSPSESPEPDPSVEPSVEPSPEVSALAGAVRNSIDPNGSSDAACRHCATAAVND